MEMNVLAKEESSISSVCKFLLTMFSSIALKKRRTREALLEAEEVIIRA